MSNLKIIVLQTLLRENEGHHEANWSPTTAKTTTNQIDATATRKVPSGGGELLKTIQTLKGISTSDRTEEDASEKTGNINIENHMSECDDSNSQQKTEVISGNINARIQMIESDESSNQMKKTTADQPETSKIKPSEEKKMVCDIHRTNERHLWQMAHSCTTYSRKKRDS